MTGSAVTDALTGGTRAIRDRGGRSLGSPAHMLAAVRVAG
jgi:hypothetical protein